ncbi:hypothetical protein ODZ83_07980 [Acaricomes phytoseiuli]|uniref:hypothetical protein n=1 Tax=Acaricomes phytoseiuli TaxID=291968 RepID=UPI0003636612|nr:hypothetical protein [Acaricomes phytoseiuli]MCW1250118.1 hypothetical protein [Acaricomes phytoseiuli]
MTSEGEQNQRHDNRSSPARVIAIRSANRATWKVICNDLPLGLNVPDGKAQESVSNGDDGAPLGHELELAQVQLNEHDVMTVNLPDLNGAVLFSTTLSPT